MKIQAPVPNIETTTVLPSPKFSDSQSPQNEVDVKQSMNGTLYSYVKSNARHQLRYDLTLSRMKALELRAFIQSYYRAKIRLTNHLGEVWDGYLTSNPFEFNGAARGVTTITLEFEGILVQPVSPSQCE